ncbi:MAG: tyrosine--tRNA ligase [Anaerolineae bacterium]|nr:tyrosine--tRNA ligase [Anaerolineae bacterium]
MTVPVDEQVAILMRGTEYGDRQTRQNMEIELRARLKEGRPLRVYCGYDPTKPDLHVGHTITMRKLRQFQELGHDVTFLIGTYTSLIGDPSDKNKLRPILTPAQVEANAQTYAEQAFKILDRAATHVRYNADWLSKLTFADLIQIGSNFTLQQFLQRENFAKRFDVGDPIFLHETFYALMQAYDAVALDTDVQVGGTDQLWNIIVAGRKLQEVYGQRPQIGIITAILPGTDGVVKMSKSTGNHIGIFDPPHEMYGKVMSIPDEAMWLYYDLVTRFPVEEISRLKAAVTEGHMHPMDAKKRLAWEITEIYHSPNDAAAAAERFATVFQQRELPEDMPSLKLDGTGSIVDIMVQAQLVASKSEARRLIEQGGVKLDGERVDSVAFEVPDRAGILQVGRRKFVRLVTE